MSMKLVLAKAARAATRNAERLRRAGRHRGVRICALILTVLCAIGLAVACADRVSDSCTELRTCAIADAGSVADGDGYQPGSEADAPSDAGPDIAIDRFVCDPSKEPKDEPCVLDDTLGVFVASLPSADAGTEAGTAIVSGDGSHLRPYPTIGQALANLGGRTRIYVCNGVYAEQVSIATSVTMYGGLVCSTGAAGPVWSYAGGAAQVNSPSPAYAVSVMGVASGAVTIEDMSFASPSATATGASSIAALIAASSVSLRRVTLKAGNGVAGAAGADGIAMANYAGVAPSGGPQVWNSSPTFTPVSGGPGGVNKCAQYGNSAGGHGGLGCAAGPASPGLGTAGTAMPPAPATMPGRDGVSYEAVLADGGTNTTDNDPGADGVAGEGGVAAPAQAYGTLSPSGWMPSPGGDGAPGNPGQGGAGGTDPFYNACTEGQSIGGGGGGAGGCGGAGGKGGGGGGASLAIAALNATIDMQQCVLGAGAAGAGGAGGAGQDGQAGGAGGDDVSLGPVHKPGAAGGNGAGGSGGAGGTGGISVGILYLGSMITSDMPTNQGIRLGPPGAGGAAGAAGKHSTAGVLTTGVDGNVGAVGVGGTSVAFLKLM